MRLADKVAIVTGAGTGIGAAIAQIFAHEGAKVTITGRRKEPLDEVAGEIAAAGGHALAVPGSVTDEADVQRAVRPRSRRLGASTCWSTMPETWRTLGPCTRRPMKSGTTSWMCF